MVDRHKTLRELASAFETRHEKVLVQLKELDGVTASANSETYAEIDLRFRNYGDKTPRRHSCQGNLFGHAMLSRTTSDGPVYHSGRSSLMVHQHFPVLASSKLPRIPVRRMSSDHARSRQDFAQIQESFTNFNNVQKIAQSECNLMNVRDLSHTSLKRGSFPREQDRSFGYQRAPEEDGPRRRRASWCSAGRKPRPSSCQDMSRWRTGLHRRTLKIEDDDDDDNDDDYQEPNRSRNNSSSSGFSSMSSLF